MQDIGDTVVEVESAESIAFHVVLIIGDSCTTRVSVYDLVLIKGAFVFDLVVHQLAKNWFGDSPCYEVVVESKEELLSYPGHRSPLLDDL